MSPRFLPRVLICLSMAFITNGFISCQKSTDDNTEIQELKDKVESLEQRVDSLSMALANTNSTVASLSTDISKVKSKLDSISSEITSILSQIGTTPDYSAIQAKIAELQAEYAALQQELNQILSQLSTCCCLPSLAEGLVAHYPFTGNAKDSSGHGLDGTVNGSTLTTDRFGTPNRAYSFDVNKFISVTRTDTQNVYPLSINLWYNVTTQAAGKQSPMFTKYSDASWNGFGINVGEYGSSFGVAPFYLRDINNRVIGFYNEEPFLQENIAFGKWYNYTFVVDNTGGKIYVDGVLISTHNWTGTPGPSTSNFLWEIGGIGQLAGTDWFKGKLDDIRIYNRVLTQSEITYLAAH